MTDHDQFAGDQFAEGPAESRLRKSLLDPAATLTSAMVVYIFINLLFGLPLVLFPAKFFDLVGLEDEVASQLGGLRWVGATLLAWAISGILVLARPGGRAIFVTAGSLQLSLAAAAMLYSTSLGEYEWSLWFQLTMTLITVIGALYMWWARLRGRSMLRLSPD